MNTMFKSIIGTALACICFLAMNPDAEAQRRAKRQKTTEPEMTEMDTYKMVDEKLYQSIQWRSIGPYRGGRSCAVTGIPGKPNEFLFGSTGGGVWKTMNGGQNWDNISDGYFGGSIGSIAIAASDPNVIYVGGGEKTVRGNVSYGYGIWKSVDGGKTWESKGLPDSRHVSRIRIHPSNPEVAYAAVMGDLFKSSETRGVYKTTDGGDTWERILFANADAGCVDLILDPNNPRILYASTWRIRRTPYSLESGGEGSALWKSTDSGASWTNITANDGLPKGTWGIVGIAVSPANSDRVWALIENQNGGVFRSDDGGKKWTKLNSSRSLRQRAWYYTRIYADPQDEDVVYVMNVNYHKSKDGGKTFVASNAPHGDHHDLWIAPEDPNRMVIGDDGGAQITYDGGETWSTYYNQPTAQYYRVTTDNHFPYRIYVAQQDNSTQRVSHRSDGFSISEDDWESTAGCECGHIAIDPRNQDIVYGGCYDGLLQMLNHETGESRAVNVWPDNPMGHGAEGMKYRFQWNFPIFFSPHDPNKLYTASNHLHVSTNQGQSWDIISPDLTRNDSAKLVSSGGPITKDNTSVEYYCTLFAAAESPRVKDLLWVGSDDGLIHISQDGGQNWENITPPNMPEWMMINSIEPDPHSDGGCYVAGTLYKTGDYQPYLYKTEDYGKTWKKIVNGIDPGHFTRVLRADPNRQGLLYAGTESGMYISFDDGAHWQPFQLNLPIVPITDLAIKEHNLIAATQGRSIWIIDDLYPLYEANAELVDKSVHLYQPQPAYRMNGAQSKNVKNAGINRENGVMVHFYLKDEVAKEDTISLTFKDARGEIITLSTHAENKANKIEVKQGANQVTWNTQYPPADKFDGMILWWASLNGPKAVPGSYTVELSAKGEQHSKSFEILKDPRTSGTVADIQKQFDFAIAVRDKLSETNNTVKEIRSIRSQMNNYVSLLKDQENMDEIKQLAKEIDSMMTSVETELYQTKNQSRQDPLNFPIRLNNKLGHLNSLTQGNDFPPTAQAVAVKNELTALIDTQIQKFNTIKKDWIPKFNDLVKEKSIEAIILKAADE